jgi:hypothetical protein
VAQVIMSCLITSSSPNASAIGNGRSDLAILLSHMDNANSKSDASPPLGSEPVSASGWWTSAIERLSGSANRFSSADASSGATRRAPGPPGTMVEPNVTSFSGGNGSMIGIDGNSTIVQNANQPWSLTSPDTHTLRFEVHSGDHWSNANWSDLTQNNAAERSEVALLPQYGEGTQVNLSYQLTVQPGATNTASWLVLNQFHTTSNKVGNPPFAVEMNGEHLLVVARYMLPGQTTPTKLVIYRDPKPIQRGQSYDMNIQVNFDNNSSGYLNVWRDGVQIVHYQGPIGYGSGETYYWKAGIYRAPAIETIAVDYQYLQITTLPMPFPQQRR